jgi:hypothetical protein
MAKSADDRQLGILRSAAVISLGLVALAGSIAASLYQRMTAAPTGSPAAAPKISQLVLDEWEADLARLNLPTKSEVEALQRQLAELEAQIDQLVQSGAQPKDGN